MLQGSSALKTPVTGVKDGFEVLTFDFETTKRKQEYKIDSNFPPIMCNTLVQAPDMTKLVHFYKGMAFGELSESLSDEQREKLIKPSFTNTAETKKLCNKLSVMNFTPMALFTAEISDFEKLIDKVLEEVKSTEGEIGTLREMNQFLIMQNAEQQKYLKERGKKLETHINKIYNACFDKLKEVSNEWDDIPPPKQEEVKDFRTQIATQKQRAFERLFVRTVSIRSQLQEIMMEIDDDVKPSKHLIPPLMRERAGISTRVGAVMKELSRYIPNTAAADLDGDARVAELAGKRIKHDLVMMCSHQYNYHCELRDLFQRACETEHSKKLEFQKLSTLLSVGLDKDGILVKCSENLLALEIAYMAHRVEVDENLSSTFDDVLEIKQEPSFVL